ncbi:MAG: ABC transporter ATP-binding protein, partial [Bacilli bacterium]|nr:ABC transporter ATP-binding protein [Bacilli bacterium]
MPPMMRRRIPLKKEKADFKAIKKIVIYSKRYLWLAILAILLAVVGATASIIGPEKISDLVNIITKGIMGEIDMNEFNRIAITLVIIYAVGAFASYIQQFIMASVTQ